MEQLDPHYLAAIIECVNASERPVSKISHGSLCIEFEQPVPPAPKEPEVKGFTPGAKPAEGPADNSPGAMHRRLTGGRNLPEFAAPIPTKQSE